jgi:hypothetical protein
VRAAIGARIHFNAFGDRCGATQGRANSARGIADFRPRIRVWIFDCVHHIWCVCQRRGFISGAQPQPSSAGGWSADHIVRGLHLIGWLAKISLRAGLVIGIILIAVGVALTVRPGIAGATLKAVHFYSLAIIFLLGPAMTRWLNRDIHFRNVGGQPGIIGGFLMGFAFAFGWTPCIGPILAGVLAIAATRETIGAGNFPAGVLLGRTRDSISRDRLGNRRILEVLPALSPPLACRGSVQRRAVDCRWRPCVREPIDMAFG